MGSGTTIKITPKDRLQAHKYSKKYRKDFDEYLKKRGAAELEVRIGGRFSFQTKLSPAAKALCEKYNLRFPINPYIPYKEPSDSSAPLVEGEWDEIGCLDGPVSFLAPPSEWKSAKSFSWRGKGDEGSKSVRWEEMSGDTLFTHINGKLVIMIDPLWSQDQILRELKGFLGHWIENPGGNPKENPDMWDIYRRKEFENKNYFQIIWEKYELKGQRNYSKKFDKHYMLVKRACEKARKISEALKLAPAKRLRIKEHLPKGSKKN